MSEKETTFDFGSGPVPAHRHKNGGGWVADSATVDDSAYVGPDSRVYGNVRVSGNARVYGNALVYGNAVVSESALVYGNARVYGVARVPGNVRVYGPTWVVGNAYLHFGSGITPNIEAGDLWVNKDGSHTVRLGCWKGSTEDLRALAQSDSWPSGGDEEYRNRWSPSLLAVADLCDAHLAAWSFTDNQEGQDE